MAARCSRHHLDEPERVIAEADRLRGEALRLAAEDADAYGAVLAARRLSRDSGARPGLLKAAFERATEVPLAIAAVGAALASLGSVTAAHGNPNLAGDAFTAVILADAATRSAARLVELNVGLGGLDRRCLDDLRQHLAAAAGAVARVSAAPDG